MSFADGIYSITIHDQAKWAMELSGGSSNDHTQVQIWEKVDFKKRDSLHQLWVVKSINGGYYTFQNLRTGSFLDMADGDSKLGNRIIGFRWNGSNNQHWKLESDGIYYKISNVASGTYANLKGNYRADGTPIIGYTDTKGEGNGLWYFERKDMSALQIDSVIRPLNMDVHRTSTNPIFYVTPKEMLQDVWNNVSVRDATVFKAAAISWLPISAATNDISVLIGYAQSEGSDTKLNWTLSDDHSVGVLFSPVTGKSVDPPSGKKSSVTVTWAEIVQFTGRRHPSPEPLVEMIQY
ncbi:ricin B lectin domain-containing protein [Mycena filopes]|nr:ricin B lectin domain-containing protein [Mycena filopes]